jgi:protein O-mannosyl-transferase
VARQKRRGTRHKAAIIAEGQPAGPAAVSVSAQAPSGSRIWLLATALALATSVAYSAAFKAPFVFDDVMSIQQNASIRHLWPPQAPLEPAPNTAVAGRPVVNYTLALNYAFNEALGVDQRADPEGRYKTASFHVMNLLLHLICGALLFAVVRQTFRNGRVPAGWASTGDAIAGVVTAIWLLHPIQTEAVDYVVQRTELVVSCCYVGTLYASIRAWDASTSALRARWYAVAVVVCLLGMGSKEVMITAPLMVLLYDRAFRSRSRRETMAASTGRRWFYLLLFATAGWSVALIAGGAQSHVIGFGRGISWYQYFYTQCWAIPHYLRLVFWPDQLTLDYGRDPVTGLRTVPGFILLMTFGLATVIAWTRPARYAWFGFLGAWFFLILAPSSSVVPLINEVAAERRIYLALASILVLAVVGIEALRRRLVGELDVRRRVLLFAVSGVVAVSYLAISRNAAEGLAHGQDGVAWVVRLGVATAAAGMVWFLLRGRRPGLVCACIGAALVFTTFERSKKYATPERLWREVVARYPDNPRAYNGVAYVLLHENTPRPADAEPMLRKAIALDPSYLTALHALAGITAAQDRLPEAKTLLERELSIDPEFTDAAARLGIVLLSLGESAQAVPYLERADPRSLGADDPSGATLVALGKADMATARWAAAAAAFEQALKENPNRADAMQGLGDALTRLGRPAEAVRYLEDAVRLTLGSGFGFAVLAEAYAETNRADDAARAAREAVQLANGDAVVFLFAGEAMLTAHRADAAERYLAEAARLSPSDPGILTKLGIAEHALGKNAAALALLRRALDVRPDYVPARDAIEKMRRTAGGER